MTPWDETTLVTVRATWADLLIALVRSYRGQRTKMWSRLPAMMCAAARQTASLDRWYTITLRSLQIESQGSAAQPSSLCWTWTTRRAHLLTLGDDAAEVQRRALRVLRAERDTITAAAQLRWEEIKGRKAEAGEPEPEPGPTTPVAA